AGEDGAEPGHPAQEVLAVLGAGVVDGDEGEGHRSLAPSLAWPADVTAAGASGPGAGAAPGARPAGPGGRRASKRAPGPWGARRRLPPQRSAAARAIGRPRPAPGSPRRPGAR